MPPKRPIAALGACALGSAVGGCVQDDTPPTIVEAEFEDARTVIVRFSEPLAPVDGVDPSSHFRLGVGFALGELGLTAYYDLAQHFQHVPGYAGALAETWPRHGLNLVGALEPGDTASELRLVLRYPIEPDYVCATLVEAATLGIPSGVYLHYAEAGYPRVTDEADNPLASIGDWWVSASFSTTKPGAFPLLDPRIEIPCPG